MKPCLVLSVLSVLSVLCVQSAATDPTDPAATAEDLLRQAYTHSPRLAAAHARWQAALERIPQARALPDPRVGYGYFVERMETRQRFMVEQMFPGFGKRALQADIATAAARAAADEMEAVAADMRAELLQALAEWVFIGQARAVVAENHRLVGQLEEVARRQYQTGNASQADVLRLQMEQASLAADIQDWEARRLPARARLNAIIGRPAATPLPPIATLPFALLPEAAVDTLAALPANPELRQRQSRVREAESARELARRAARPDFMLGIEYMDNRRMERDEVLASAAITIPLWRGRYQALTREATAGLRAARQEYQASRDRLAADAHALFYEIGDSDRRLRLFADNLLPRARQTLAIVEADYQTGRAGFLDLLEAQRAVLAFELGQARAATDHFQRLAAWERLVGPFADPATDTLHSPADQ